MMTIKAKTISGGKGRPVDVVVVLAAAAAASVTSCANLEEKVPIFEVLSRNTTRKGFKCDSII